MRRKIWEHFDKFNISDFDGVSVKEFSDFINSLAAKHDDTVLLDVQVEEYVASIELYRVREETDEELQTRINEAAREAKRNAEIREAERRRLYEELKRVYEP